MKVPVEFAVDVRNSLYSLREQGADVGVLWERLEALDASVPKADRGGSKEWLALERDVYEEVCAFRSPEPSDLESIRAARPRRRTDSYDMPVGEVELTDRIGGGWYGRIAGCILGKPVECLMKHLDSRAVLLRILRESGEFPMSDFVSERTMVPYWTSEGQLPAWYEAGRGNASLREYIRFAPADDDLNYTVLALDLLGKRGLTFTPDAVLDHWVRKLSFNAVCTAEKLAYRNRVMGLSYPDTATFMNPYGEWIGAQIRADAYGYVLPGRPEAAARAAWQDAAASHVRSGIYGAMWVAACIASAYLENEPEAVIRRGLEQIPGNSRFADHIRRTVEVAKANGDNAQATLDEIWQRMEGWHCVHAINNACIVAAGLMHGGHDLGKVICTTVMGGWDTDCTGATAGSIAGVMIGSSRIEGRWKEPFSDTLHTSIEGRLTQKISELVAETCMLVERFRG